MEKQEGGQLLRKGSEGTHLVGYRLALSGLSVAFVPRVAQMQASLVRPPSWQPARLRRKSTSPLIAPLKGVSNNLRRVSKQSTNSYDQEIYYDGETVLRVRPPHNNLHSPLSPKQLSGGLPSPLAYKRKPRSCIKNCLIRLQSLYEKSRIHYLFPIIILVAYSLLGGLIFYTIEAPNEELLLIEKSRYLNAQTETMVTMIWEIRAQAETLRRRARNRLQLSQALRSYQRFAINDLKHAVYWYTLSVYYLTDHESYKSSSFHSDNDVELDHSMQLHFRRIRHLKNYTEQLSLRCWEIGLEMGDDIVKVRLKLNESLELFNQLTGLHQALKPTWTFWNSMFLAVTTYTTIGYGNITAKSRLGKLAAMLYAVIGIPLVLMILHKLGRFFLVGLQRFWDAVVWVMRFFGLKQQERIKSKRAGDETAKTLPVLLAVGVAFGWMFLCAAIFLKFEKDWDYFKSFYFFFCSLTTIGYGDVTPTNSEDMFIIFGFIIIGLSLVSMCINVVQQKLEQLFEELLMMMMEEYEAASEQGLAPPDMQRGMGMMQLWRMWKKRKARREKTASKLRHKFSLPFGRSRSAVIIDQFQKRLRQVSRATQTDLSGQIMLASQVMMCQVPQMEETEFGTAMASLVCMSSAIATQETGSHHPMILRERLALGEQAQLHSLSSPSSVVASVSGSTRVSNSSSSQDSSQSSRGQLRPRGRQGIVRGRPQAPSTSNRTSSPSSSGSAQSAPTTSAYRRPSFEECNFDPSRRWTFVETGKVPRGCPRGLVVPAMYMHKRVHQVYTTDMKRLIREIDARLADCRNLVTPTPSNGSSSSSLARLTSPVME